MTDGWIEWNGGECPVPGDTVVKVKLRCGHVWARTADNWDWLHNSGRFDIVLYRVLTPDQSARIAELFAEVERLREALIGIEEYWNREPSDGAMLDALETIIDRARAALEGK